MEENKEVVNVPSKARNNGKTKRDINSIAERFSKNNVNIALLIKNNAEIRRFTALGILNYLTQKGRIKGEHKYVSFKWNKFAVKCDGLVCEYLYTEPFFLNALCASFISFSASAQNIINAFVIDEVGNMNDINDTNVNAIVELNNKYQETKFEAKSE